MDRHRTPKRTGPATSSPAMRLALFLLVIAGFVFVLLATQPANYNEDVSLMLPFVALSLTGPLLAWVAGSLGAGFLLGYIAALPGRFGASRRARQAEKELALNAKSASTQISSAHRDAAAANSQARVADARADAAAYDAAETQRLADEVARRTAVGRDVPPPRNI